MDKISSIIETESNVPTRVYKYALVFFILCICVSSIACQSRQQKIDPVKQVQPPLQITAQTPLPEPHNISEIQDEPENKPVITNKSKDIQMVFHGFLEFKDGKLTSSNDWAVGEGKLEEMNIKQGILLDVMTCTGFVSQARLKKWHGERQDTSEGYQWELEFLSPDLNTPSMEEKLIKCSADNGSLVVAFAIYPSKPERAKIEIKKTPDLEEVLDSLPAEQRKWIKSDDDSTAKHLVRKGAVDIDVWTDSDGDGKIDLIQISGSCSGSPTSDYTCFEILHLIKGKWRVIGELANG